MATLESLTKQTAEYAKIRRNALDIAGQMQAEIEAVQEKYNKQIIRAVTKMTEEHEALSSAINTSKSLFEKTKSMTIDGIKIGFQKGKDKLSISDTEKAADKLATLIDGAYLAGNKALADLLQAAVKPKWVLVDSALKQLDTSMLNDIGITYIPATDDVLIKPQDSDSTKAIDNIIKTVLSELES